MIHNTSFFYSNLIYLIKYQIERNRRKHTDGLLVSDLALMWKPQWHEKLYEKLYEMHQKNRILLILCPYNRTPFKVFLK